MSMKDIAQAADVSVSTVSAVLNNKGDKLRIAEDTRKRVLAVARDLGYTTNVYARKLARNDHNDSKYTMIICIFWELNEMHTLFTEFIAGIQEYIHHRGRTIEYLICPYESGKLYEKEMQLKSGLYHGMIFVGLSEQDEQYLCSISINIPFVLFNRNRAQMNSVSVDSYQNGQLAASCLLRHRPKNMVYITSSFLNLRPRDSIRRTAFFDQCVLEGMAQEHIHQLIVDETLTDAYTVTEEKIKKLEYPCGVFVASERILVRLLKYTQEHRIHIPEDILIVSNIEMQKNSFYEDMITNIALPTHEMSYGCMNIIDGLVSGKILNGQNSIFQCHLQYRQSCPEISSI